MKLTLEQFETQFADNNLSVTDWFDTTYGLFKELEALDRSRREWYQKGYRDGSKEALQQPKNCNGCINYDSRLWKCSKKIIVPTLEFKTFCCNKYEPKEK